MAKKAVLILSLMTGVLASCGGVAPQTSEEGQLVMPTLAEIEHNKVGDLYLAPTIQVGNKRFDAKSNLPLFNEADEPLSWDYIGIGQTATFYSTAEKINKVVVHGDPKEATFLWYGEAFFDEGAIYFRAKNNRTFLYKDNCEEKNCPSHIAMKVLGRVQIILDVGYQREGSSVFYSPNPSGFIGYEIFA